MERVLISASGEQVSAALVTLVRECYPRCDISVSSNGSETRRAVSDNDYDAVVINCPLSDEFGSELAEFITAQTNAACLMIVHSETADDVAAGMEEIGVMVIPKPIVRTLFRQSMRLINASRLRMLGIRSENIKLHKKLEEMRIINRAKFALMQYLRFSEAQAHKYLEKQAMNMRTTRLEVAKSVIKTYEP